ncbi:protein ALTERED XYLOGLUCAN 4-like [Iris pallida]|uniref:Protein ALTERED XYLOGLUCAN 4-like n=1 Tax=Iris pallida TaxID=29817 RepID=A0AAX6DTH6_IRIPA|nr:protein ALTERED XYLOGLUCAN 4-like [Iris pallida]
MTKIIVTKPTMRFLFWFVLGSSILLLSFLSCPNPFVLIQKKQQQLIVNLGLDKADKANQVFENSTDDAATSTCDLFDGRWVREYYGNASYSNYTCRTLPESKNCGKYGKEQDFVNWRWKPDGCDLPRFDGKTFLNIVRGKRMAFVGDSVARNQMESLLCLLSQVETPVSIQKDSEDRFRTWYFRSHDFILTAMWTKFLVAATERTANGTATGVYDLHLDRVDTGWTEKLPWINYLVLSGGHWFSRKLYLHESDALVGCVYCSGENLTDFGPAPAVRRAFRTALAHINGCADCGGLLTLVRTFAPAHFENGAWDGGGKCNRTEPLGDREVGVGGTDWGMRNAQVEELRSAQEEGKDKRFEVLDVTKAMMARADAHPGEHWNNEWMKGYSDCVHWCLPGPIDVWNDMLLEILKGNDKWAAGVYRARVRMLRVTTPQVPPLPSGPTRPQPIKG